MSKSDLVIGLYRTDFEAFNRFAFRELHPHIAFRENWHTVLMADRLSRCAKGEIRRLIINVPPRYLKSHTASVSLPLWMLGRNPQLKIMSIAGTRDLASDLNQGIDRLLRSGRLRTVFPNHTRPERPGQIRMQQGGQRVSGVVGKSIIGRGADVIIIDDPMPPSVAWKDSTRRAAIRWYADEVVQRLNDKSTGIIILVMHRVHPEGLTQHLLDSEDDWHVLSIPAIATEAEAWRMPNGNVVQRRKGEALMPSTETREALRERLLEIGASSFAAQYQQAPFMPQNKEEVRGGCFAYVDDQGVEHMWFGHVSEIDIMLHEVFGEGEHHPAKRPTPVPVEEWCERAEAYMAELMRDQAEQIRRDKAARIDTGLLANK